MLKRLKRELKRQRETQSQLANTLQSANTSHIQGNDQPQTPSQSHGRSQGQSQEETMSNNIDDEIEIEDGGKKKKTRGFTLVTDIWNMPQGKRIIVNFDIKNRPTGDGGRVLGQFLGTVARKSELVPIGYKDWRLVPYNCKEEMWRVILTKFQIPQRGKPWVLSNVGNKLRTFKCHLKAESFYKFDSAEELKKNPPPRVCMDQWVKLVDIWMSNEVQERCEINRKSRGKQTKPHTSGTKSFSRKAAEMEEKMGVTPSRAELYIETHIRKNGTPVDKEAAENIVKLKEFMSQNPDKSSSQGSKPWEGDVYSQVMGKERPGRVRCYGSGPMPHKFKNIEVCDSKDISRDEEVDRLKEQVQILQEKLSRVPELEAKVAKIDELEAQLARVLSTTQPIVGIGQVADASSSHDEATI